MRWPDAVRPARMSRVAVVAPQARLREALVVAASTGTLEIDDLSEAPAPPGPAQNAVAEAGAEMPSVQPTLSLGAPNVDDLLGTGRWDLLAGEAELERRAAGTLARAPAAVATGWTPSAGLESLRERLAGAGASVVELPHPATAEAPTLMRASGTARPFRPLVQTYAVVPYADLDPTMFAGITYVLMFGMMFGDVGHGLLVAVFALWLRRTRRPSLAGIRAYWFLPFAAGLAGAAFGMLYGEAFGPTGLVPALWLAPMEDPVRLLVVAVIAGGVLLGASYVLGIVNRWREAGPTSALYEPSGLAGTSMYLGAAIAVGGLALSIRSLAIGGAALAAAGLVLLFVGFVAAAGRGFAAILQSVVETFDAVIRVGTNAISFARLAAFGLTHAAIGWVVWSATASLWGSGVGKAAAVLLLVVGNAAALALEGLVVAVQALRLEYYELFSRILTGEGRLFDPWRLPVEPHTPLTKEDT